MIVCGVSAAVFSAKPPGVKAEKSLANAFKPVWSSNEDRAGSLKVRGLLSSYDHLSFTI